MDNKQATEAQKGWLGGIIDGEGSISMSIYKRGKNQPWRSLCWVRIDNTNKEIIDEAVKIIKLMDSACHVRSADRTVTGKVVYQIIIKGLKRCNNFLPKIYPYLRGKYKQAEVILGFVERRTNHNKLFAEGKPYYTKQDLEDIKTIRLLNHRGRGALNDYTLPSEEEFIKIPPRRYSLNSDGNAEKQAEMTCSLAK